MNINERQRAENRMRMASKLIASQPASSELLG